MTQFLEGLPPPLIRMWVEGRVPTMMSLYIMFVLGLVFSHCSVTLKLVSVTFLLVCFESLIESTYEIRKNAFYFTMKALFVLEIIKF